MNAWKVSLNTSRGVEIFAFVSGVGRCWGVGGGWAVETPHSYASVHTSLLTLARVRVVGAAALRCLEFVFSSRFLALLI